MPKRDDINKVLLIGSGPIQIGQAAEFDYSGSQACQAFREEGVEVILVNSNPATIMTDPQMADAVYIEPLTIDVVSQIIEQEKPDGIAAGLGGQTGLNLTAELAEKGVLDKHNVEVLGTPIQTIYDCEDRLLFKQKMEAVDQKVPRSRAVESVEGAQKVAKTIGFPAVIRPAYTLGGAGGGIAHDERELNDIVGRGLKLSRVNQVLVEQSVMGWKEFEYEVMRDGAGTCLTVVNMENLDPMGVHTGESVVVAPSQTLSDEEHHRLRSVAVSIIEFLGIEGGCNIQFAVNPRTGEYKVVEVNPRVSRSSALASKASGYPIARVAAKIAIGLRLSEIPNDVTAQTPAAFEPALDYTVVKIPWWPFEKFKNVDRELTTQMKSTGEVMAIGRSLGETFQKALRSLHSKQVGFDHRISELFESEQEMQLNLEIPTNLRLLAIYEALSKGKSVGTVAKITAIDPFWVEKIKQLTRLEGMIKEDWRSSLVEAKQNGFVDKQIAEISGEDLNHVEAERKKLCPPRYKMVDTCAGEFRASTPYFYSTYEKGDFNYRSPVSSVGGGQDEDKVLILGAGPIRIGQGIEFDYCCVQAVRALREEGCKTLMMNNNPETVSTDYDTADRLYFEPLTIEDVMNVIERERPQKIMVQFGGQTSVNLALPLHKKLNERNDLSSVIAGTSPENMDVAEDRKRFTALLDDLNIPHPQAGVALSRKEARNEVRRIGYPVLVRPSYVLGGRAMKIVYDGADLRRYIEEAVKINPNYPVLIDEFIENGIEVDVDAVSDGSEVLIGGIMEHVEEAGVHSGDSACVIPPQSIDSEAIELIVDYVKRISLSLEITGLVNFQFAVRGSHVYVLEANPRASRTVPFVSKATGIPLAKIAAKVMIGGKLGELGYGPGPRELDHVAVKEVVFPFSNLPGVDPIVGPEMQSTGEVMGIGSNFEQAFYKAQLAADNPLPSEGKVFISVKDKDKPRVVRLARKLIDCGLDVVCTSGTAEFLNLRGVSVTTVSKVGSGNDDILNQIKRGEIALVINTPTKGKTPHRDGFKIRRAAVEMGIPYIPNIQLAKAAGEAIGAKIVPSASTIRTVSEYHD